MKEEGRKHVSLYVDPQLWRRLKACATLRGVKMGEMLDLVLEKTVGKAFGAMVIDTEDDGSKIGE